MSLRARRLAHGLVCFGYNWGFGVLNPVIPFHARACIESSASSETLFSAVLAYSIVLSSYSFTKLIFLPFISSLADIFGRAFVLRITMLGLGVTMFLSAYTATFESMLILRALMGVFGCNAALLHAWASDLADVVDDESIDDQVQATRSMREDQQRARAAQINLLMKDGSVIYNLATVLGGFFVFFTNDDYAVSYVVASIGPLVASALLFILLSFSSNEPAQNYVLKRPSPLQKLHSKHGIELLKQMMANPNTRSLLFVDLYTILSPRLDFVLLLDPMGRGMESFNAILTFASIAAGLVLAVNMQPRWLAGNTPNTTSARCYVLLALTTIVLPISSFQVICVLAMARAIIMATNEPAEKAAWSNVAPDASLSAFIGIQHTVRGLSQTIGPFMNAWLVQIHPSLSFVVLSLCHLLIAFSYIGWAGLDHAKTE